MTAYTRQGISSHLKVQSDQVCLMSPEYLLLTSAAKTHMQFFSLLLILQCFIIEAKQTNAEAALFICKHAFALILKLISLKTALFVVTMQPSVHFNLQKLKPWICQLKLSQSADLFEPSCPNISFYYTSPIWLNSTQLVDSVWEIQTLVTFSNGSAKVT